MTRMALLITTLSIIMLTTSSSMAIYSPPPGIVMDPIDSCLFTCVSCYGQKTGVLHHYALKYFANLLIPKQLQKYSSEKAIKDQILMACANDVCLQDMVMNFPLGDFWRLTCPRLIHIFP